MEMHVIMAVDMIQMEPGLLKSLKLCTHFSFQLLPYPWPDKETDPGLDEMRRELTSLICQARNGLMGQDGSSSHEHQMQTHPERRKSPRSLDGICRGAGSHHQAGGSENSLPMSFLDGFVHRYG